MASPLALPALPALAAAVALAVAVPVGAAGAQGGTAPVPALRLTPPIDLATYGGAPLEDPPEIRSSGGVLAATLTVGYTDATIAGCPVRLAHLRRRAGRADVSGQPGRTRSPSRSTTCCRPTPHPHPMPMDINVPHDFNTTNLHTHGLHVSPSGQQRQTSCCRSSRGRPSTTRSRSPTITRRAPFLGTMPTGTARPRCRSPAAWPGRSSSRAGWTTCRRSPRRGSASSCSSRSPTDRQGVIESYDDFGPGGWQASHRQTLINGQVAPTIEMAPGAVERWRMIHGGVRETLRPVLRRVGPLAGAPDYARLTATAPLRPADRRAAARDRGSNGLALGRIDTWDNRRASARPAQRRPWSRPPMVEEPTEFLLTDGALSRATRSLLGRGAEPERDSWRGSWSFRRQGEGHCRCRTEAGGRRSWRRSEPVTDDELDGAPQAVGILDRQPDLPSRGSVRAVPDRGRTAAPPASWSNDRSPTTPTTSVPSGLEGRGIGRCRARFANHPFHIHVNPFEADPDTGRTACPRRVVARHPLRPPGRGAAPHPEPDTSGSPAGSCCTATSSITRTRA